MLLEDPLQGRRGDRSRGALPASYGNRQTPPGLTQQGSLPAAAPPSGSPPGPGPGPGGGGGSFSSTSAPLFVGAGAAAAGGPHTPGGRPPPRGFRGRTKQQSSLEDSFEDSQQDNGNSAQQQQLPRKPCSLQEEAVKASNNAVPPPIEVPSSSLEEGGGAATPKPDAIGSSSAANAAATANISRCARRRMSTTSRRPGLAKGQLIFSADFESGNLARAVQTAPAEWELQIRSDTHNPRHRLWFHFRVSNCLASQKVLLSVMNFSKARSLYREGMTPVVRSRRRPRWQRIPSDQVFYYRSPAHSRQYVLSWAWEFDREGDEVYFAYCFPFTYTDLQRRLHTLDLRGAPWLRRETLCRTAWGRRLDLLTLTAGAGRPGREHSNKKWVFITSRIHPGETPAQFVVQGLIDFLMSGDSRACVLRENIVFKIIPMLNPDGVALGNYRCNYLGYDLNRQWAHPQPDLQPEIVATKELVLGLHRCPDVDLDVFIDIHAHSVATNGFMYCNSPASPTGNNGGGGRVSDQGRLPRLYDALSEDFSWAKSRFDADPSKEGTGRRELGALLAPGVFCYTLETSFFAAARPPPLPGGPEEQPSGDSTGAAGAGGEGVGGEPSGSGGARVVPFTQAGYEALGRNLALTFIPYYGLEDQVASAIASQRKSSGAKGRQRSSDPGAATASGRRPPTEPYRSLEILRPPASRNNGGKAAGGF